MGFPVSLPSLREFDVVLLLDCEDGGRVGVGAENKYRSGPSNTTPDSYGDEQLGGEADRPAITGNQLADEYQGLHQGQWHPAECARELAKDQRMVSLYITGDYVIPRQELAAAVRAAP